MKITFISLKIILIIFIIFFCTNCKKKDKMWEKVKQKNTIDAYGRFMNFRPNSEFRQEAQKKLINLRLDQMNWMKSE